MRTTRRPWLTAALAAPLLLAAGCAGLPGITPPRVTVVGIDSLPGEGFEIRFALKLRVQNPNGFAFDYDGIALDLDVNGRPLASGVSADKGSIPRFGEALITVPVSVSAVVAVRQMFGFIDGSRRSSVKGELPYALRGRLGGGSILGGITFASEGSLRLPQ